MINPVYLTFIGKTNSGKKEALRKVTKKLALQDYFVIVFKHQRTQNISDNSNEILTQNDAKMVFSYNEEKLLIIFKGKLYEKELLDLSHYLFSWKGFQKLSNKRITLLEGFRNNDLPEILCAKSMEEIDSQINLNVQAIAGKIAQKADKIQEIKKKYNIPVLNLIEKPQDIEKILIKLGNRA